MTFLKILCMIFFWSGFILRIIANGSYDKYNNIYSDISSTLLFSCVWIIIVITIIN